MTRQEMFDTAVRGVISQGAPSVDRFGGCLYRGPNGLRCAAGWLIPDDKYSPELESKTVDALEGIFPELQLEFLGALQCAHDYSSLDPSTDDFVANFKRRAKSVARDFRLNAAALAKASPPALNALSAKIEQEHAE